MNLSVYVGFCVNFVQLYDRLPSLEEQAQQKKDFETQSEKQPRSSLLDVFKQNKRPCEICDDYRQFKGPDPTESFMLGTFQSKWSATQFQNSGVVTYVPVSETWHTTLQDKLNDRVQKTDLTHEEFTWQIELYNQLESKSLDPKQFALQMILFKNNEFQLKPNAQYQHAVFKRMLTSTNFKFQLDSGGNPSWLHAQVMFLPLNKGNVTIQTFELDQAAQQQSQPVGQIQQRGFLPLDVQFNIVDGVERFLEVPIATQKEALSWQLSRMDTATMLNLQSSQTEAELTERLKIKQFQSEEIVIGDQPIPPQITEGLNVLNNERAQLALCQFLWNLCSPGTIVVPLMPVTGNTYISEPQRMQHVPSLTGKRIAVPYVEVQKHGNISSLTRYQIIRQVRNQLRR